MNLQEILNSLYYGEWLIINSSNEAPQRIDEDSDDWLYNNFIVNGEDIDIKEELENFIYEYYDEVEDLFVHIYNHNSEDVEDDTDCVKEFLTLQKSYPFKPSDEELKKIFDDE